jgi:hypothetical protein
MLLTSANNTISLRNDRLENKIIDLEIELSKLPLFRAWNERKMLRQEINALKKIQRNYIDLYSKF